MKKRIFILFIMFSIIMAVNSQNKITDASNDSKTITINIDEAVTLALKNNLDYKNANLSFDQKKWAMATSGNVLLPTSTISGSIIRMNKGTLNERTSTVSGLALNTRNPNPDGSFSVFPYNYKVEKPEWSAQLQFDVTFTLNAYKVFNIYQTVLDYKGGKIDFDTAKSKLIKDVKSSYHNVLITQKYLQIMQDTLNTAEKRYNQAVVNYKNGLKSEYDMLSAEVSYENLKPSFLDLKNNFDIAVLSYKQLIGVKSDINLIFQEVPESEVEITEYNSKELIDKNLDNRLDMKKLNLSFLTIQNLRNMSISALTPSLIVKYTMNPQFQRDALKDAWFSTEGTAEENTRYNYNNWKDTSGMLMLGVSIPLSSYFPFSTEQMKIVNASYAVKQYENTLKNIREKSELEINQLVMKLTKSIKSIDNMKLNVKLAEKAYKMADDAYKAGSKDLLQVQDAQDKLNTAKFNLLKEQFNYVTGMLDLQYALEIGSPGSSGAGGTQTSQNTTANSGAPDSAGGQ